MMKMGMRLETGLSLKQEVRLAAQQRLKLKQLLELRLELRSPEPQEAKKGLEGIGIANQLLEARGLRGILIGSLAEDIWKTSNIDSLARHKDVDVAVLSEPGKSVKISRFEKGIDWWLPETGRLKVRDGGTVIEGELQWWENGNGVVIGVGLELAAEELAALPVGLSIPTPRWMINMRVAEILARQDQEIVSIEEEVIDALRKKLEKEMNKTNLPLVGVVPLKDLVPYVFQFGVEKLPENRIRSVSLQEKNLREIIAINSRKR